MCDKNEKASDDPQYESPGFTVQATGTIWWAITAVFSSLSDFLRAVFDLLTKFLRWLAALIPAPSKKNPGIGELRGQIDRLRGQVDRLAEDLERAKAENARLTGIALQGVAEYNPPMTDAEFQTIADQIDELEGSLQKWKIFVDGAVARLPWLHDTIITLMWASQALGDQDEGKRVKYAALEQRSRQCREILLRRKQKVRIVTIAVIVIGGVMSYVLCMLFAIWRLLNAALSWIDGQVPW